MSISFPFLHCIDDYPFLWIKASSSSWDSHWCISIWVQDKHQISTAVGKATRINLLSADSFVLVSFPGFCESSYVNSESLTRSFPITFPCCRCLIFSRLQLGNIDFVLTWIILQRHRQVTLLHAKWLPLMPAWRTKCASRLQMQPDPAYMSWTRRLRELDWNNLNAAEECISPWKLKTIFQYAANGLLHP